MGYVAVEFSAGTQYSIERYSGEKKNGKEADNNNNKVDGIEREEDLTIFFGWFIHIQQFLRYREEDFY